MKLTRNQLLILGLGIFLITILAVVLILFGRKQKVSGGFFGDLVVWGVFDDKQAFSKLKERYAALQPRVSLTYVEKDPRTYEQELVNALATPDAPDVFMVHNTWLPKHASKLLPLVPSHYPFEQFRDDFPVVVTQDFAPDGIIYALPLFIDTLALYYNEDLFDQNGVALPPATWEDVQRAIPFLRETDSSGRLLKAAAAIGGSSRSINRAPDILSLLMLQSGTQMVSPNFGSVEFVSDEGLRSLKFYADFANPASPNYTWHDNFSNSIDAFSQEDAAMMFNYGYQAPIVREKNPFLNFKIIPMPQPGGAERAVNFANYWGFGVNARTRQWQASWNFVNTITRSQTAMTSYAEHTGKTPALRSLIQKEVNDPVRGVFARQALTARSWPQIDNNLVDSAFSEAIRSTISGRVAEKALREAAEKISAIMTPRDQ